MPLNYPSLANRPAWRLPYRLPYRLPAGIEQVLSSSKVYYNIQDLSTLYQDAAGTNVCTAAGQRVKLALDTRRAINPADNVLDLDGASGDYASTPDSVANSPTGSLSGEMIGITLPSWSAAEEPFFGKRGSGDSFQLTTGSSGNGGKIRFFWWEATVLKQIAITTAVGFSVNSEHSLAFEFDASDGSFTLYTSDDLGETWTLFETVAGAGATSIDDTASSLFVFSDGAGGTAPGKVRRMRFWKNADRSGAATVDFNPADKTADGATWVSSTTGETWTQNGNARVVPSWSNYALQTTTANAPYLGIRPKVGKRNTLEQTEAPENAYWQKGGVTVSGNVMTETTATSTHRISANNNNGVANIPAGTRCKFFADYTISAGTPHGLLFITGPIGSNQARAWFNLSTGAVGSTETTGTATVHNSEIEDLGGGKYRCMIDATITGSGNTFFYIGMADADLSISYAGSTGRAVVIDRFHAQRASESSDVYQKVEQWYLCTEGTVTPDNHVYSLVGIAGSSLFMTIPGSASELKFLHDGTGAYVVGGVQFGNVPDPDAVYPLLQSTDLTSTSGVQLYFDDRSASGRNDRIGADITNGSASILGAMSADNALDANTPVILSYSLKNQTGNDVVVSVDGSEKIDAALTGTPSSANSGGDLHIFSNVAASTASTALLDSLIITDYVPSGAAQTILTNYLAQSSGIKL